MNYMTHDCRITMRNNATGNHRTVRIRTQKADAKFAPGERIISLLIGPDNESSYEGFGFVKPDGAIIPWRKARGTTLETIGRMIERQDEYESRGVEYLLEARCRRCGRTLTTPESIEAGIGPECATRD